MQCEKCFGEMISVPNRRHAQCRGCGNYHFDLPLEDPSEPLKLSGQSVGVICPKCKESLEFATLHGRWRVCLCKKCRGYVIDSGCLGVIVHELRANYRGEDASPVPLNPRELDEHRSCPACDQWMETHPYHGPGTAVINSCSACKVTWMDHQELASIIRAPGFRPKPDSSPFRVRLNPNPIELQDDRLQSPAKLMLQLITGISM